MTDNNTFSKHLRISITIGVGETRNHTKLTEQLVSEAISKTGELLLDAGFGGFTVVPSAGGWRDPSGRVVVENGVIFVILTEATNTGAFREHLTKLAGQLRDLFEQSCVLVEVSPVEVAFV